PDPDQALRHLVDFTGRRGVSSGAWSLLGEHRPLATLLISLFGTSEFLARRFVAHPELLDELLLALRKNPRKDRETFGRELRARLENGAQSEETAMTVLRQFKQQEELRIGLHDIAGELDQEEVTAQLSYLAEALVQTSLALIAPQSGPPMALLA